MSYLNENKLQAKLESELRLFLPVPTLVVDYRWCIYAANKAALDLIGLDNDDISGLPLPSLLSAPNGKVPPVIPPCDQRIQMEGWSLRSASGKKTRLRMELESRMISGTAIVWVSLIPEVPKEIVRRSGEYELFFEDMRHALSHDLQSPLRKLKTFCDLLDSNQEWTEEGEPFLDYRQAISENASTIRCMVQDLLIFSKIYSQGFSRTEFLTSRAAEAVLARFEEKLQAVNARVEYDSLPVISGDPEQFSLLLEHLIDNSLKFCDATPPVIQIEALDKTDHWEFQFKDNGAGIESKYAESAFEIFRKLPKAKGTAGTGMGLAICRHIVERHRGKIWLEPQDTAGGLLIKWTMPKKH